MSTGLHCPDTPEEAGLPETFEEWRDNQQEAIESNLTSVKRVNAICAPTGFGKTAIVLATAKLSGVPTCIVTSSRGLQDQYLEVAQDMGIADLRGGKNYTCVLREDENYTCEDGYSARCTFKGTINCPRSQAEMRAATSNLVLTNYDKWTSSKKYGQGLNHIKQVIFDEGHTMPDALANAMETPINAHEINDVLGLDFPTGSDVDDMREWKVWAIPARAMAEDLMIEARSKLAHSSDPKHSWVRHYLHMKNLMRRLATISTAAAKDWIVDQTDIGFKFDPIRPGRYAESTMLLRVPKIGIVSATLRPKTLYMSGIPKDHFVFTEYASAFDPARCPIYYVPTMTVKGLNQDLSMLWLKMDQFIAPRKTRNGIIHTISYARQQEILQSSRFSDGMIANQKGEPPTKAIEEFKALAGTGARLVSPSVSTGYDFPGDECRWQFVCKIPFEPPSKILKARQDADKEYSYYRAMQYLVQAFGRDMRSETDWSERVIADDQADWFIRKYGYLAPKSFHAVFHRAVNLPRPLNL